MTAAQLRSLTITGAALPCSPVRFVGPDGEEYVITAREVTFAEVTTDAETKQQKPAAVPVLTLHVRPLTTPIPLTEGVLNVHEDRQAEEGVPVVEHAG
jgi:hypothetical protein